jgi:hypothetical protein
MQFLRLLAVVVTPNVLADTSSLIGSLTSGLGVSSDNASGGAGALFDYAKGNMNAADFGTVSDILPGGGSLIDVAPEPDSDGLLSSLDSLGGSSSESMA